MARSVREQAQAAPLVIRERMKVTDLLGAEPRQRLWTALTRHEEEEAHIGHEQKKYGDEVHHPQSSCMKAITMSIQSPAMKRAMPPSLVKEGSRTYGAAASPTR